MVGVTGLGGGDVDGARVDKGYGFREACLRAAIGFMGDFGDRICGD
jgi:hypothetical protein